MLRKLIISITLLSLIFLPFQVSEKAHKTSEFGLKQQIELPDNFDKVYKTFHSYNKNTDTSLVVTFCDVAKLYGLDTNEMVFDLLLGQALQESGAQQYRKDSSLVVSSTGAVGFAQILRSTSILYLRKCITKEDSVIFNKVGVTDFSFVHNDKLSRRKRWDKARVWLSNYVNNIAMWGKIMSDELKRKDIHNALICYNVGPRKHKRFLAKGNEEDDHHYIISIKSKLKFVK